MLPFHPLWRLPVLTVLGCLACPSQASGACPVPSPPCEAMRKADLVFYGEVLAASRPERGHQRVTFRVVRPFKGAGEARFTAAFRVTREGVYFVAGQRRVVYASAHARGRWSTDCARSALVLRPPEAEVDDLAKCPEVRAPRSRPPGRAKTP